VPEIPQVFQIFFSGSSLFVAMSRSTSFEIVLDWIDICTSPETETKSMGNAHNLRPLEPPNRSVALQDTNSVSARSMDSGASLPNQSRLHPVQFVTSFFVPQP
jgi:hypothetical protein